MSNWRRGACALAVAALLAAAAQPQPATATRAIKGPCAADAQRLCGNVQADRRQVAQCLRDHRAELSAACKQRIQRLRDGWREARKACQADIEKFCKDVELGRGRILNCLRTHAAELSPACKSAAEKRRATRGR